MAANPGYPALQLGERFLFVTLAAVAHVKKMTTAIELA
jgi:hypothetical protein